MIDFKKLIEAGTHFGHLTSGWFPKMKEYIWGVKDKVHLIDVSKTAFQLEKAAKFLEGVVAEGKQVLWVGTKRAAQDSIKEVAQSLHQPYVNHRWVGGTLSNFGQVKKSVTKLLYYEDILEKSAKFPQYTKQEFNEMQKAADRLETSVGGIRKLAWPVGAVILVDVNKERSALQEAVKMGIPVIAIVDTNADPSLVDYVIPANDDSTRSIRVILDYLAQAVKDGQVKAQEHGKHSAEHDTMSKLSAEEMVIPGQELLDEEEDTKRVEKNKKKKIVKKSTHVSGE